MTLLNSGIDSETINAVTLALTPGIGQKTLRRLLTVFDTLDAILTASDSELQTVPGIGPKTAAAIRTAHPEKVAADLARFAAQGIGLYTWYDTTYPAILASLDDAPLVLFYRGQLEESQSAIAIVGTREPSPKSIRQAETLAADFAERGWVVISGLARGIDTAAHRGALDAGGRSVAVLGCGINRIYPAENTLLARQIGENGALLSEYHPTSAPSPVALTMRNRIISGLSRAVIVIEAGAKSGSLYAAQRARSQGRAVFAIDNQCAGNVALLAKGALPAENADQIIQIVTALNASGK